MNHKLYLHQEIMLLAIRDDKGTFSGGMYLYAVAGALVSELLMMQRIAANDDKKRIVAVIDESPTGDPIMDEVVQMILGSTKAKGMQHWVTKVAQIPKLKHRVAQQLCEKNILRHDEEKVLWLFTQNRYPELDGSVENAIRDTMAKIMFDNKAKPDARTAVLVALAHHAGLLNPNFAKEELRQHKKRIKEIASGDILATGATKATIEAIQAAVMVATMIPIMTAATVSH